jgi:hypothetical protein
MGPLRNCMGGFELLSAYPAPELEALHPTGCQWLALKSGSSDKKTRKSDLKRHYQSHTCNEAQASTIFVQDLFRDDYMRIHPK